MGSPVAQTFWTVHRSSPFVVVIRRILTVLRFRLALVVPLVRGARELLSTDAAGAPQELHEYEDGGGDISSRSSSPW